MQKKLIALAVAGLASTAAFAQSNVTIYGVADATFDNVKASGSGASATDIKARNRVASNSSYIGFKGAEDLGNGLKAVFQIENGINLDGTAGVWNNRDSFVGLAGGFGTVVAGNLTGPTRALGAKMDVNSGATGVGSNNALIGKLAGVAGSTGASAFDQRLNNAVAYVSPNFSGFTGVVGYTTGYSTGGVAPLGTAKETFGAGTFSNVNTGLTLGANYENGPIYAGYAYTNVDVQNGTAIAAGVTVDKVTNHRLGGKYDFGVAGVGLLFDQTRANLNGAADLKQNVWYLSGTFNVGAGKIISQFGWAQDVKGSTVKERARHFEIGYEHSLSKRTILKAVYSAINNNANTNYDFLYGASAANTTATAGGLSANADPKALSLGVRHSF